MERDNVARKLIRDHLVAGSMRVGDEIGLRVDQTLIQDATGTMVMLELEALGIDRVRTEVSVQYVDHNLVQEDFKNPDDHLFLESACRRFGVWFSRPGNGVSHPLHMKRFGVPRKTLLGSDSHTPAGGAIGMLAIGAGGIEVAMAMAGEPFFTTMPAIWGIRLEGALHPPVSAKDAILEMLRRHGVSGGVGRIVEYHGPGLRSLSAWDRHVIANMGAELGATTTVFPSDTETERFLAAEGRAKDFTPLSADAGAGYDVEDTIDLSSLVPLVAKPSSPGNVVPVTEVAGAPIAQVYIGSSANPGFRDFAVAAEIVRGQVVPPAVSFDINPSTRGILEDLMQSGHLGALVAAGARLHQVGCNGCIGMGQAPATGRISLRTVPRNFPGRSGTREDSVYLVSPETAAASALRGVITDPRELGLDRLTVTVPAHPTDESRLLARPPEPEVSRDVTLVKGPNIRSIPKLDALPEILEATVELVVGDDVSTDEILPAGARVLPFRSNIDAIADFAFDPIDEGYAKRARARVEEQHGFHAIVAGANYGQGSSREHAALAPRHLGLRMVIARSFARIHRQNLVSFGVLPLTFVDPSDRARLERGTEIRIVDVRDALASASGTLKARIGAGPGGNGTGDTIELAHRLSTRQIDIVRAGGLIPWKIARDGDRAELVDRAANPS